MAIVKVKSLRDVEAHCAYLISEKKHSGQSIIELNDFQNNIDKMNDNAVRYKENRRGHTPKPISYVLSFPAETTTEQLLENYKEIMRKFYSYISNQNHLNMSDDNILETISALPSILHIGKHPHIHIVMPRVICSNNGLYYVNLSKPLYVKELKRLNGWTIEEKVKNDKIPSLRDFREQRRQDEHDALKEEFERFKDIGGRLYELAMNDLKRGHTDKAQKKLVKMQAYQQRMETK